MHHPVPEGAIAMSACNRHEADPAASASAALKGAVKLANEIIGTMNLMESGIPVPPGVIGAMRRHLASVKTYVDATERAGRR